jgi:hypothetical protein
MDPQDDNQGQGTPTPPPADPATQGTPTPPPPPPADPAAGTPTPPPADPATQGAPVPPAPMPQQPPMPPQGAPVPPSPMPQQPPMPPQGAPVPPAPMPQQPPMPPQGASMGGYPMGGMPPQGMPPQGAPMGAYPMGGAPMGGMPGQGAPMPGGAQPPQEEDTTPANFQLGAKLPAELKIKLPKNELTFDQDYFTRLLAGSISLSRDEKKKIIDSIPKLKQSQVDELTRIFEEEKQKFAALSKKHVPQLEKLADQHFNDWVDLEGEFQQSAQKEQDTSEADEIRKNLGI